MKSIIVVFCLIVVYNCNSQIKESNDESKKDNIEYFDIENYTNLPINPYTGLGIMPSGDEVQYFKGDNNNDYIIRIKKKDSPITVIKIFFEKSKSLKFLGQDFYNIPVGIDKEYDENGKINKETDNDKDYKFSIEDLISKMKEEYKVDILNTKQTRSVNRNNNEYLVICDQQARNTFYNYGIDGTTGETLSIKIIDGESEYKKLFLLNHEKNIDDFVFYKITVTSSPPNKLEDGDFILEGKSYKYKQTNNVIKIDEFNDFDILH